MRSIPTEQERLANGSITYSCEDGRELLSKAVLHFVPSSSPWPPEAEANINGEWMELARTDLKGQVCSIFPRTYNTVNQARAEFIGGIRYGVRVLRTEGAKPIFAVIDRLSDG